MAQLATEPVALEFVMSQWKSRQAMWKPNSTVFFSLTWEWTQLDAELGLNTASKTDGSHFDNRRYTTEVIYSGSDRDFGDDKIWQEITMRGVQLERGDTKSYISGWKGCVELEYFHISLGELSIYLRPNRRWWTVLVNLIQLAYKN